MFRRHPGLNRQVLCSLHSGNAVSGVLVKVIGPWFMRSYVLRGAMIHEPGVQPVPADGEIFIEQVNVDYLQIVSP